MTDARKSELNQAAALLIEARKSGNFIATLPDNLQPQDASEHETITDHVAAAFGEIGGYKIGAANLEATPSFAPMPKAWFAPTGFCPKGIHWHYRGLEAEIAFVVGQNLPPRDTPYTRDEAIAAMASCHPVIEILETGFIDPSVLDPKLPLADIQRNGGFVYGPAFLDWQNADWNTERVTLAVDGIIRVDRTGSNTSGDLLRLLPYLANQHARTGGLKVGQWITTGSWTGNTFATSGSVVDVEFSTAGKVNFRFD
ncbi:MAG: fumarylacetoacetate hydrolase family protein [Acidobacteriota bacterium]